MSANDEAVHATNDDAASCKRSAVQLGYWSDPYIQFVTKASDRKPPEISRGYYARVKSVQGLVRQFLEMTEGECQVINLGAGSDTWYWNLVDEQKAARKAWVEVDFSEVTARKLYQIKSRKQLLEKIQAPVYMSAEKSSALVKWIAESFTNVFFVNYEQVNMNDRFGKVMISNLEIRGCPLAGVQHCQSLDSQKARFTDNGWHAAEAVDDDSLQQSSRC